MSPEGGFLAVRSVAGSTEAVPENFVVLLIIDSE